MNKHPQPITDEKTSRLLNRILAELPTATVNIEDIIIQLHRRSFGGVLIMLAAISLIPGISIFSGLAMAIIGLQMLAGFSTPRFPKFIRRYPVDTKLVIAVGEKCIRTIKKIEHWIQPRWLMLTLPPMLNLLGAMVFVLSLVIMMPLPFSNLPPAIAIIILAMGLLERDGLLIAIGFIMSIAALAIGLLIASFALESLNLFLDKYFS